MRDCVFFLADKSMGATFLGFLERTDRRLQLGCGPFEFLASEDLFIATGQNDPGLYTRAHELLRPFQKTHRKAVVVLDCEWDGSPGQLTIINRITALLRESGWSEDRFVVIAINPELEEWIWQDSPVLTMELRHAGPESLRAALAARELWPIDMPKPPRPKEVFVQICNENRVKKSAAIFKRIAQSVPVGECQDSEFQRLAAQLQAWFPAEVEA